jgi:hypothetical protein
MTNTPNDNFSLRRPRRNTRFEWSALLAAAFVLLVLSPAFSSASVAGLSAAGAPAWQVSLQAQVWNAPATLAASAPKSYGTALHWLRDVSQASASRTGTVPHAATSDFHGEAPGAICKVEFAPAEAVGVSHRAFETLPAVSGILPRHQTRVDASRRYLVLALSPHAGAHLSGTRNNRSHE